MAKSQIQDDEVEFDEEALQEELEEFSDEADVEEDEEEEPVEAGPSDKDKELEELRKSYEELETLAFEVAAQNEQLRRKPAEKKDDGPKKEDKIKAIDTEIAEVKKKLKKAFEEGEAEEHSDLTEKLADLKRDKYIVESAPEREETQQQPVRQAVHPKVARWAKENPWFSDYQNNADAIQFAVAVSQRLESNGISPANPKYFEQIDAEVNKRFPELKGGKPAAKQTGMPVQRNASAGGSRKTKVELTPLQVSWMKRHGISREAMAREVLKVEKQSNGKG